MIWAVTWCLLFWESSKEWWGLQSYIFPTASFVFSSEKIFDVHNPHVDIFLNTRILGFANAGYVASIPIMILATILFLSSSACLLDSWKLESEKEAKSMSFLGEGAKRKRTILSYPGMFFEHIPDEILKITTDHSTFHVELAYRALGQTGESMVKVGIALMQSGVCLTYLIFVSENLKSCTQIIFGYDLPASYFISVMLIFQIPLSWIRDIRKLTVTNLVANILTLYGLIACLAFAFSTAMSSDQGRKPLAEISYKFHSLNTFNSGWFLFIGTSVSISWHISTLLPTSFDDLPYSGCYLSHA
jgi:proton-coupled amino acid transporter